MHCLLHLTLLGARTGVQSTALKYSYSLFLANWLSDLFEFSGKLMTGLVFLHEAVHTCISTASAHLSDWWQLVNRCINYPGDQLVRIVLDYKFKPAWYSCIFTLAEKKKQKVSGRFIGFALNPNIRQHLLYIYHAKIKASLAVALMIWLSIYFLSYSPVRLATGRAGNVLKKPSSGKYLPILEQIATGLKAKPCPNSNTWKILWTCHLFT